MREEKQERRVEGGPPSAKRWEHRNYLLSSTATGAEVLL